MKWAIFKNGVMRELRIEIRIITIIIQRLAHTNTDCTDDTDNENEQGLYG